MRTFIAIGSNIGDRHKYVEKAIDLMEERAGTIVKRSTIIETKAYGYTDQDDFLNMAVELDTNLQPRELLKVLQEIELELHRVRKIRWGPRTIDLDIIYYENKVIDEEDLHIPHIDLYNRDFVLEPIVEIDPSFIDPRKNKTTAELLDELKDRE